MQPTTGEVADLAHAARGLHSEATVERTQVAPHRNLRRRLSPQAIDKLVARYMAGEETPALSREFGISASGVRELLRAEGVSLRGHAITPEDAETALHLYARGLTITQVVAQVGYSFSTIRRMLHANGVAVRERGVGRRGGAG